MMPLTKKQFLQRIAYVLSLAANRNMELASIEEDDWILDLKLTEQDLTDLYEYAYLDKKGYLFNDYNS